MMDFLDIDKNDYDKFLSSLIPQLPKFDSCSGGEGAAYFIDKKFVVKEYSKAYPSRDSEQFEKVFDSYCMEIQKFAEEGYSVPKIYSWCKIPNANKERIGIDEMPYKYYILEENIPGRWVYYFYEDLDEMYKACKEVCSKEQFLNAIGSSLGKIKLKQEILKAYIADYIKVNTELDSMADDELEKFIISSFRMATTGTFSSPDLFRKNILLGDDCITLIDNRFRYDMGYIDQSELDEYFLLAIIDLIEYNKYMDDNLLLNSINKSLYNDEIGNLILKNRQISLALTQKILNILNKKMGMRPISNEYVYEDIESMISRTFKDDASKVIPMIQTEFDRGV